MKSTQMQGITQESRKHIIDALRVEKEKNNIIKILKQKSQGSQKRQSNDKQHEEIMIQDQDEQPEEDMFQQQNLYNQMPSNSNSKKDSMSYEGDNDSQGSAHQEEQQQNSQPYNYTFNKYHNQMLQDQMRLTKAQVEENEKYLHRDMLEQNEEQEEDEEDNELNEVNQNHNFNSQQQSQSAYQSEQHYQQNGNHYENDQQSNHTNNFQNSQISGFSQNTAQQVQNNYDHSYDQADGYQSHQYTFQNSNGSSNLIQKKSGQPKYFISDKPVQNSNTLNTNKSHQDLSSKKKYGDAHIISAKEAVRDIKYKLMNLRQEKEKKEKEIIKHRIEEIEKRKNEHTFHPQCKLSQEQEIQRNTIHKDPLTEEERCSAWLRLYDDKKQFYEENKIEKQKVENTKVELNCYQIPEINVNSKIIAEIKNKERNLPVEDRLISEGVRFKQKIESQQHVKQVKEVEDLTFKPQIYSQPLQQQPPIYERFTEIAKKKQDIIHQLKMQEQSTFQPQINARSAEIAEIKINNKNVSERLNSEYVEQQKRKEKLYTQILEETNKECKFQPTTNPSSSEIVKSNPLFDGRADVVQRQQAYEKQSRDKKLRVAQELENNQCQFKPQINQISELLVIETQGRLTETQQQKIDRLYKKEIEMRKMKNDMRQKEYDSQNTFAPSINEVSRYIVNDKPRDLDELAYNYTGKMHIKMLQEEKEFEEMQKCSFYPSTTQSVKYLHVPSYYNQEKCYKSVKMEVQIKEKKLREQKKQYINKELKECTFKPAINKSKQVDKKSNIETIKGLENFLQNKDKAERMKQDRLQKEDEMFNLQKKYDIENRPSYTVAQPFKLSHYNKQIQQM